MTVRIRIATRKSELALWQAGYVADELRRLPERHDLVDDAVVLQHRHLRSGVAEHSDLDLAPHHGLFHHDPLVVRERQFDRVGPLEAHEVGEEGLFLGGAKRDEDVNRSASADALAGSDNGRLAGSVWSTGGVRIERVAPAVTVSGKTMAFDRPTGAPPSNPPATLPGE